MATTTSKTEEYMSTANTGTDPNLVGIFPDSGSWIKSAFIVTMGKDFATYKEILEYSIKDEVFGTDGDGPKVEANMRDILDDAGKTDESAIPRQIMLNKFRDTSLGGNDAVNCLYQFNENDDIIHPFTSLGDNSGKRGMGRVYSENIDDNQQIMYMTFGVPKFSGITTFYKDAIQGDLAALMNGGDWFSVKGLGRLLGTTAGLVMSIPFLPFVVAKKLYDKIPNLANTTVTKYYDLQGTMPLYYKCVNSIIAHLAVNMGLVENGGATVDSAGSSITDKTANELQQSESGKSPTHNKNGWDIYSILCKKYTYNKVGEHGADSPESIDDIVDKNIKEGYAFDPEGKKDTWLEEYMTGLKAGFRDTLTYVGFRIEKSVDTSESVSNSTGESSLAATLNDKSSQAQDAKFTFAGGTTGVGVLDAFIEGSKGVLAGLSESVGVDGLGAALIGSGRLDIPEVWTDSSFSKSYSFNMALRAPYGDPTTIMESIYIPLAMIMAGALPRAVGQNAYTSPFLVSAYSKGMFSIPLGIIDSLTIKRGSEEHGWNYQNLPTCIDISFSIKDLSPTMYMAIADGKKWLDVFGQNSTFQEYLLTLSGTGLAERKLWIKNMKRRIAMAEQILRHNRLNAISWGISSASTRLGRLITACHTTTYIGK